MFSSAVSSAPSGDLDVGDLDNDYYPEFEGHQQDWKEPNPGDDNFKVRDLPNLSFLHFSPGDDAIRN